MATAILYLLQLNHALAAIAVADRAFLVSEFFHVSPRVRVHAAASCLAVVIQELGANAGAARMRQVWLIKPLDSFAVLVTRRTQRIHRQRPADTRCQA